MGLVLDEPTESETIYRSEGLVMLGNDQLQEQVGEAGGLNIDYVRDPWRGSSGFRLSLTGRANSGCAC